MKKFLNLKTLILVLVNAALIGVIGFVTFSLLKNDQIGTKPNHAQQVQTTSKVVVLPTATPKPTAIPTPTTDPKAVSQSGEVSTADPTPTGIDIVPPSPTPTQSVGSPLANADITPTPTEIVIARAYTPTPADSSGVSPTAVPSQLPDTGNPFWLIIAIPIVFVVIGFLF